MADVPVQVIVKEDKILMGNTRSALALMRARIPFAKWGTVDMTGDAAYEANIAARLAKNKLGEAGTDTIRITGAGKNVSNLQ